MEDRIKIAGPEDEISEEELRALVGSEPVDVVALVAPAPTVVGKCLSYDFSEGALWATVSVTTSKTWGYELKALNALALATRDGGILTLHGVYLTPLAKESIRTLVRDALKRSEH